MVAWGFHLPPCYHCCIIVRHTYATETAEGIPRRVKRSQQSMETRHAFAGFSGLARFDFQADLPTPAAANTVVLHHSACCAFGVFFFSLSHRTRRQLCGLLALYYSPWLRVLAGLRSTFALNALYLYLFNTLAPCRSPCDRFPVPPISSPTPPSSKRSPTSAAPNTMTSGTSIPRLFSTSMRIIRPWISGSMSWALSLIRSSTRPTRASTTTSSSRCSCALSSPLRRCSASTSASQS